MQHEPGFMNWHKDGAATASAIRPGLVTAGAAVLLLGVACLILGAFAGLGPASEGASAAPQQVSPVTDPLDKDPLTSGEPTPAAAAPSKPVVHVVARKAARRAPATVPKPAPSPKASSKPNPGLDEPADNPGTDLPDCSDLWGSDGWGSGRHSRSRDRTDRGSDGSQTDRCRWSTDSRNWPIGRSDNNNDRYDQYGDQAVGWGGYWSQGSAYGW